MVSSISAISACSAGVANCSTGAALRAKRGSPILRTGLIIAGQKPFDDRQDLMHGLPQDVMDRLQADALATVAAPGGVVGDDVDRRIRNTQFTRQNRLRHGGHADHVSPVALEPIDLGRRPQPRALRRGLDRRVTEVDTDR